LRALAQTALCA